MFILKKFNQICEEIPEIQSVFSKSIQIILFLSNIFNYLSQVILYLKIT